MTFREGEENRVIRSLGFPSDDPQLGTGIPSALSDDIHKGFFQDIIRAGRGYQNSPGIEEAQRSLVQLAVSPGGARHISLALGKGGRVQDDAVIALPGFGLGFQKVEDIFFDEVDRIERIQPGILPGLRKGILRRIDGHYLRRPAGGVEGEKTLITEGIQNLSLKEPAGSQAIFPLIQIGSGFCPPHKSTR